MKTDMWSRYKNMKPTIKPVCLGTKEFSYNCGMCRRCFVYKKCRKINDKKERLRIQNML